MYGPDSLDPKWWRRGRLWVAYWWFTSDPYGLFRLCEINQRKTWYYERPSPKHAEVLRNLGWTFNGLGSYYTLDENTVESTVEALGIGDFGRVYWNDFVYNV